MKNFIASNWLLISQLLLSVILIVVILIQRRGSDLGGAFGQNTMSYGTKRGLEKILFYATIVTAVLFFLSALAQVY